MPKIQNIDYVRLIIQIPDLFVHFRTLIVRMCFKQTATQTPHRSVGFRRN
jgi:hypothetical protein